MRRKSTFLFLLLVCMPFLTSCSNSSQENSTADVTAVINAEDYLRYPVSSRDGYKIACFAVSNSDWIIAAQKWKEADALTEQEGTEYALGFTQAMEARLQKGQDAEWNGAPAEDAIRRACSKVTRR
jgi:hypothetical protein